MMQTVDERSHGDLRADSAPFDLAIDSGGDQFPVSESTPRLTWKSPIESEGPCEIQAVVDGVTLGSVLSVAYLSSPWVSWPWQPLRSRQRVKWRVRIGAGQWSHWHDFEVGLLDVDWHAGWISPVDGGGAPGERPAHRLVGRFSLDSDVRSARLYSTALGLYEAHVNGRRVGTAELLPGATSYDRTLYAQASDVTDSLRRGANSIEILLSDGWYRGRVGAFRVPAEWGERLAARAELHIDLVDGSHRVIVTDETWAAHRSEITRADLMGGQSTDLLLTSVPSSSVLVDRVVAPPISWSPAPPVRVVEHRQLRSSRKITDGVWVLDFGQNASGWVVLDDLGPAGTETILEYGEFVDRAGDLSTSHLDSYRQDEGTMVFSQRDEVISAGAGETFEPRHTVHGFQYVRVTRRGAEFDPASASMRVVHTDFRRVGSFDCDDQDLTRLHELADWSFRGNAVDIPTDCPTRERLGWTGDYQVFAPTATRLYDVSGFTRKWLRSVRDDQMDDGRIANFSPDGRRVKLNTQSQFAMMTGSAGWGDAIVAVPWEMYRSYGDEAILAENWEAMVRWVRWAAENARTSRHPSRIARSATPDAHEQYLWDGSFHWGEWIEPKARREDGTLTDPVKDDPAAWFMADKGEVGTAFLYRSAHTVSEIAHVLGRGRAAEEFRELSDRVAEAWRTEFLDAHGHTVTDTQAAYVRALSFGLVPDQLRPAAAARLVELIGEAGGHLTTGFLSTGDLLPVLADHGYPQIAYGVLRTRTSPSWLNMIDRGATTIWEDWDGIDERGVAHESLNHYSKGAVVRFLHSHILGLRQADGSAGWERVVVSPLPDAALTRAHGVHESPRGTISVSWSTHGGEFSVEVELPAGTTGTILMPDGSETEIGPGSTRVVGSRVAARSNEGEYGC